MLERLKGLGARLVPVLFGALVAVSAFAQEDPVGPVDPGPIAAAVSGQMTSIISAGVGLLVIGIGASVGWRYAKRFLRG